MLDKAKHDDALVKRMERQQVIEAMAPAERAQLAQTIRSALHAATRYRKQQHNVGESFHSVAIRTDMDILRTSVEGLALLMVRKGVFSIGEWQAAQLEATENEHKGNELRHRRMFK